MFEKLEIFQRAMGLAKYAEARQAVIARNIANADTPGYRAQDLRPFSQIIHDRKPLEMRAIRQGHLQNRAVPSGIPVGSSAQDPLSPNGNSVSLETQMVHASETRQQHELAISVYTASLNILRTSLGRR